MSIWFNLLGYQLAWFTSVVGAGHGLAWPSVLASGTFVLWQVRASVNPRNELRLLTVALALGVAVDGAFAISGWVRYATPAPALPAGGAPVWILALWAAFAMTLNGSLRYLQERIGIALALGAIGGPLAYMGAAHGWQAVSFTAPEWRGLLLVACGWAMAVPLLAGLARRLRQAADLAADAPTARTS
ncbi:MAG: DUF2878 domain-containing protein [Steroidobacteraceae bacterium]